MTLLSKSDFKTALDCQTKLYYKKKKYPSANDGNDYLAFLADGGHQVGKLATMQYPNGIEIQTGNDHQAAIDLTIEKLNEENVTLFEPSIQINNKIVRVDILEKRGDEYHLIEVKSKSFDSSQPRAEQVKGLKEYIEDLAYQYLVLEEFLTSLDKKHSIKAFLYLPDKSKTASMEGLNSAFKVVELPHSTDTFRATDVEVKEHFLEDVLKEDLLTLADFTLEVVALQPRIKQLATHLLSGLNPEIVKLKTVINKKCFKCEYNLSSDKHPESGFEECWKGMPNPEHHIKNLYYAGSLGKNKLLDEMIHDKKLSMYDVPDEEIKGSRGLRQRIQLDHTKSGEEYYSVEMREELLSWDYPIHFIDFETATAALPYHKRMRPYETVAFQWSCHTIPYPGADPVHSEWINLEPEFPNFKFAESLMDHIGTTGTVLMWATHENSTLKQIYYQMKDYGHHNPKLEAWLDHVVKFDPNDTGELIDMNKFTLDHYFHPLMKGRTSIKVTLPAVLWENKSERSARWLKEFGDGISLYNEENGHLLNPYYELPPFELFDKAEQIKDGGGAMSAYQDLLFGIHMGDHETNEKYKQGLLNYCKLDTLAMVIIWEHWNYLNGI